MGLLGNILNRKEKYVIYNGGKFALLGNILNRKEKYVMDPFGSVYKYISVVKQHINLLQSPIVLMNNVSEDEAKDKKCPHIHPPYPPRMSTKLKMESDR